MATITDIARALEEARADIALLARLQDSPNRVATLQKAFDAAKGDQAQADKAQAAADLESSYEGVTDIRVTEFNDKDGPANLLSTPFDITYTKPRYCMYSGKSTPQPYTVRGFTGLPRGAYLFLLDKRPEQIPAAITALAPDNPREAFNRYFSAMRRGHL